MWKISRLNQDTTKENELLRKSLARYFDVSQNKKPAKFQISKKVAAEFDSTHSLEELWKKHTNSTAQFQTLEHQIDTGKNISDIPQPPKSYLDLKIEIANQILQNCHFCNRKCGVNRTAGEKGFCGCGKTINVSSIFPHLGEEPELVPSGTIFTMGCTMRCLHCQNWAISQWAEDAVEYSPEELAREVENLRLGGCHNVNLVGGDPTSWLPLWLQTFKHVAVNMPVVWNSNAYYSPETAELLAGFADVYLLDFKYGSGDCAKRLSEAPDYWEVCTRNHLSAKRYGELLVRVLVLPRHLECCTKPILDWIAKNLGVETRVNLMFQYRPKWRAHETTELRRRLTASEMEQAVRLAEAAGLVNLVT